MTEIPVVPIPQFKMHEWQQRHHYTVGNYDVDGVARLHHYWDKAEDEGQHTASLACPCGPVEHQAGKYDYAYHEFDPEAVEPVPAWEGDDE